VPKYAKISKDTSHIISLEINRRIKASLDAGIVRWL
jgi:hypothetical protein